MSSENTFHDAIALHREGRLDAAEAIYGEILRGNPEHAAAVPPQPANSDPQAAELFVHEALHGFGLRHRGPASLGGGAGLPADCQNVMYYTLSTREDIDLEQLRAIQQSLNYTASAP
jgi:hypothetical protein